PPVRLAAIVFTLLFASAASAADPVILSAKSGNWSAPATWVGGKVPAAGDRVLIKEGHRVLYDVKSDAVIRGLNIAGSLVFATDIDTLLNVGLIKVQGGDTYSEDGFDCDHAADVGHEKAKPELIIGTPDKPVTAGKTALIRLHYVEGMDKEKCPAIVCCGGGVDFPRQPPWPPGGQLGAAPKAGGPPGSLARPPTGGGGGGRAVVPSPPAHS